MSCKSFFISGWGKTGKKSFSDILKFASLKILENPHCNSVNSKYHNLTDTMLCAASKLKSICQGDTGGPLACQHGDGRWYLEGVSSWASPYCDANDAYSVFTRVSSYMNWINSIINSIL